MTPTKVVIEDGYKLVSTSVQNSVAEILRPFKLTAIAVATNKQVFSEHEFFDTFLKSASSFTETLCDILAKGLRTTTQLPEIKGTPTSTLAPRIRQEVFSRLDAVLNQYIQVVNVLGVRYAETSTTGTALTGAVAGKILGGNSSGDVYAVIGGLLGAAKASIDKQNMLSQARLAAYVAIQSYLKELEHLPERLLDFGVALIYGSEVDFDTQSRTLESIENGILPRIRSCSELVTLFTKVSTTLSPSQVQEANKQMNLVGPIAFFLIGALMIFVGLMDQKGNYMVFYGAAALFICLSILFYVRSARKSETKTTALVQNRVSITDQLLKISEGI